MNNLKKFSDNQQIVLKSVLIDSLLHDKDLEIYFIERKQDFFKYINDEHTVGILMSLLKEYEKKEVLNEFIRENALTIIENIFNQKIFKSVNSSDRSKYRNQLSDTINEIDDLAITKNISVVFDFYLKQMEYHGFKGINFETLKKLDDYDKLEINSSYVDYIFYNYCFLDYVLGSKAPNDVFNNDMFVAAAMYALNIYPFIYEDFAVKNKVANVLQRNRNQQSIEELKNYFDYDKEEIEFYLETNEKVLNKLIERN